MPNILTGVYKNMVKTLPGRYIQNLLFRFKYGNTQKYWEQRYCDNRTSGAGSYGEYAVYKADVINEFILHHDIPSVIEFGCGDGNQLRYLNIPTYIGFDISARVIDKCKALYEQDSTKAFEFYHPERFAAAVRQAELVLSLDVIYHLISEKEFIQYMHTIFSAASKYVLIYSWNGVSGQQHHVKHRKFTSWVEDNIKGWNMIRHIPGNPSGKFCDFFIYQKDAS